ncbi:MAG: stage III sporulation protein AH [Oscillospiraceae bacterium]|jgi:stage III sporulation protein AH|nr:MAG: stage III sporulation protein AH [Oscillospiraceae bacterium]
MKSAKSKRQLTILTLILALGVAVYLNWEYAKTDSPFALPTQTQAEDDALLANAQAEDTPVMEALPDKNYGEAQLVSVSEDSSDQYFETARLTRTKTRDEALDKLQQSLKATGLTEEEKAQLKDTLSSTISNISLESDIENLVKAKGFADCVVFVDGEKVDLAVKTGAEGLSKNEVAQLRDIILGKVQTSAQNISIVEVK